MAKVNKAFEYQDKVFGKFIESLFFDKDKEEEKPKDKIETPPVTDEDPPLFI